MKSITLSSKNQIVIPSAARQKMGLKSGDKLIIKRVTDNEVVLSKEPSFSDLVGSLPNLDNRDPVERVRELRDVWR